jgi:hypothetical protein
MDNHAWSVALRSAYNDQRKSSEASRQIKLPSGLTFSGTLDCAEIEISKAAVEANMQSDSAAFDGWAFALMRWLGVRKFRLAAEIGINPSGGHSQRFSFRLDRFRQLVRDVEIDTTLSDLVDQASWSNGSPVLNIAKGSRGYVGTLVAQVSEADLEILLCHNPVARKRLKREFNLNRLCRQFPVGLFNGKVSAASRIFPGGKSALDLIGVDQNGNVHIFELKKPKNAKVGALSELVFYLAVLEEARIERWGFEDLRKLDKQAGVSPEHVTGAPAIRGHLLAPQFHPLLDDELLKLVTKAMESAGWGTSVDRHSLSPFLPVSDTA